MLSGSHPAEIPVYPRFAMTPERGLGCELWDAGGRRWLDLYGGHAVAITGHCHPRVVMAVRAQAERLLFYSNAVPLAVRDRLFALLAELAPPELAHVFLVNSGAEANEVALQLARRVTGRSRVVSCEGGFHGRSLATLAVSGIERYRALAVAGGGGALVGETSVCHFDDPAALEAMVDGSVAAVLVEPVQGLAGARDASTEFLEAARGICDRTGAQLIFDEVQCGCGRSGAFTAAQSYGVVPDLLTLAKGIAGGLPLGAVLVNEPIAGELGRGDLGSTFGGGPVPCAAALATLEVVRDEGLAERAGVAENTIRRRAADLPAVTRVTGRGLLLGLVLDREAVAVQTALVERGILVGSSVDPAVLRLLPPLVVDEAQLEELFNALEEVLV